MAFRRYNPKRVAISFAGLQLVGFMDGTFAAFQMDEDQVMRTVGADGFGVATLNANLGATVKITLIQASPSNDSLSALLPDPINGRLPTGEFQIKDLNGTTLLHAKDAYIVRVPNVDYAKEVGPREWTFQLDSVDTYLVGGSDE